MYTYKVTFQHDETRKTKTYTVKAEGIIPAIEKARWIALFDKKSLLGWTITKAESKD